MTKVQKDVYNNSMKEDSPPNNNNSNKYWARRYELAWNKIVQDLPAWKKRVIVEDLEIVSGHHSYKTKDGQRIASETAKEARRLAEQDDKPILLTTGTN